MVRFEDHEDGTLWLESGHGVVGRFGIWGFPESGTDIAEVVDIWFAGWREDWAAFRRDPSNGPPNDVLINVGEALVMEFEA